MNGPRAAGHQARMRIRRARRALRDRARAALLCGAWLALVLAACSGGGSAGPVDAPDDAAGPDAMTDGALVDTPAPDALPDGPMIDAPIDGPPIDGTAACEVAPTAPITTPVTTRPWVYGEVDFGWIAIFELATPVPLASLTFETREPPPIELRAGCPGPVIATGVRHARWLDVVSIEWTDGVAANLAAGSYLFELHTAVPFVPEASLQVHGEIVDGAACDDPLVAAGVLACSPRANCDGGLCVVAACSDGVDDDGDGLVDDADPGCALANDRDEADLCGAGGPCPECADTIDTDDDGLVAWPDAPGCARAGDPIEHACPDVDGVIEVLTRGPYPVPQTGTADHPTAPHCWSGGADRVFALRIPGDLSRLSIGVGQNMFTLKLYRDHCDQEPVQCYPAVPGWSAIPMGAVTAGTYWLVASASSGPSTAIGIDGTLVVDAACDPARPAFACPSGQSCQPAGGGGHRCQ